MSEVEKPKRYIPWLIGGVIATVASIGIYRLIRLAITVALVIYAFRLTVSLGPPDNGIIAFLHEKYATIVKLFLTVVAFYLVYLKKNSKTVKLVPHRDW